MEIFFSLMSERGYNNHFLTNSSNPGKLKESLHSHLLGILQGRPNIPPFYLTTYTHWNNDESPYIKCDFKVKYDQHDGFRVMNIDIIHGNQFGKLKEKKLVLNTNDEIPYRDACNRLIKERRKGLKF